MQILPCTELKLQESPDTRCSAKKLHHITHDVLQLENDLKYAVERNELVSLLSAGALCQKRKDKSF